MTENAGKLLDMLFEACERIGGSDIHLAPGLRPHLRVKGRLEPLEGFEGLDARGTAAVAEELARRTCGGGETDLARLLARRGAVDGACTSKGRGRYRFNVFRCQATVPDGNEGPTVGVALRKLEDRFRSLKELNLPERLAVFCGMHDGLVIVSGPTGSGKSTTLATLLDEINRTREGHIVTIEDPVEYIHESTKCLVNQRQVGLDAPDFNTALVDSLRQDPDIILVGEIREEATIRTAITAAETGHLVFTTLHAGDCAGAVERLISVFPAGEQEAVRHQLALVLRGIVAQRLVPSERPNSPRRRIPACEILMNTPAVANLIATGKTAQLQNAMETGAAQGMQPMDRDLARLCVAGELTMGTACALSRNPDGVKARIAGMRERNELP